MNFALKNQNYEKKTILEFLFLITILIIFSLIFHINYIFVFIFWMKRNSKALFLPNSGYLEGVNTEKNKVRLIYLALLSLAES